MGVPPHGSTHLSKTTGGIAKGLPVPMVYTHDGASTAGEKAIVKALGLGDATPSVLPCRDV